MMPDVPIYIVELRLDGELLGNVRALAQNLKWTRNRTRIGVDSITFTVNDKLLSDWCAQRGKTVADILRPLALDCRVIRNGVPVIGGFLATMPGYKPNGTSASLDLKFDGYMNLLAGVYIHPGPTQTAPMGEMVSGWIQMADERADVAGKAFGFTAGKIAVLPTVQQTFDNYKSVKDAISDRCDNITGAGPFEVYFHADRTYDVIAEGDFGDTITDYAVQYPGRINGVSASSLSANELTGFASTIIGIGAGDIDNGEVPAEREEVDPAPISIQTNNEAVQRYGYAESILQESSVSVQETLDRNTATELENRSTMIWQPQMTLLGKDVAPTPDGPKKIWVGDTITLQNAADYTGMTSGTFRVNSLQVSVEATGAEKITPSLSRGEAINRNSFAQDFVRLQREILALKTGH